MIKNIIIGILILAFIAAVVLLDIPKVQSVLDLRKRVENEKNLLTEKQEFITRIENLESSYQANEDVLKKLDYIIANGPDVPNLIVQLEALVAEGGMSLSNVNFSITEEKIGSEKAKEVRAGGEAKPEQALKGYNSVIIDIKIGGDYLGFKNFLQAVEENMRLIDIESITFTPKEIGGAGGFEFNVILQAYYQ